MLFLFYFFFILFFNWDIYCKIYLNVDVPFSRKKAFGLASFVRVERSTRLTFLY